MRIIRHVAAPVHVWDRNFAPSNTKFFTIMNYSTIFFTAILAIFFTSCDEEQYINQPGKLVPLTVTEDATLPAITVNGATFHAEAFGHPDSTIIVAIHGGPGGDYRYLLNCQDLAGHGYRVVFYDQRGSGLSQRFPKRTYTDLGEQAIDLMYEDLMAVIHHFKTKSTQKVILLGHSWGGILASGFTGRYPNEVDGLIVGEPGGLTWNDIMDYVEDSRSFKLWSELLNDATYLDQFMTGKEDQHEVLDYKMAMLSSKNDIVGEDNTIPGSNWRSGAVINSALFEIGKDYEPDFSAGLNQFDKPVLFLYSARNQVYADSWAEWISAAYNHVTRVKVPGVGHDGIILNETAWSATTQPAILDYLQAIL
jgi:proline iminopeptidase